MALRASQSVGSQKSGPSRVEKSGGISADQRIQTGTRSLETFFLDIHSIHGMGRSMNQENVRQGIHQNAHDNAAGTRQTLENPRSDLAANAPGDPPHSAMPKRPFRTLVGRRGKRWAPLRSRSRIRHHSLNCSAALADAEWLQSRRSGSTTLTTLSPSKGLGGVGTRFGWICLDCLGSARASPDRHADPSSRHPATAGDYGITNNLGLVGFAWIRLLLTQAVRTRRPCTLRRTKPTFHENRSDLVGFTRIRPPSLKPVRTSAPRAPFAK